jgi:uncharacterized membrane protein
LPHPVKAAEHQKKQQEWFLLDIENHGNILLTFCHSPYFHPEKFTWARLRNNQSSLFIFYRDEYIHGDLNINRFILMVLIFVVSVMFLIIRPNIISISLGWDGLGLVSYCLVIYYQNVKSIWVLQDVKEWHAETYLPQWRGKIIGWRKKASNMR